MDSVKQLQLLNPEKLAELCRMHLSFALDLSDDEFSILMELKEHKKKVRNYFSRLVKGKNLLN